VTTAHVAKTIASLHAMSLRIVQAAQLTLVGAVEAAEASAKATTLFKDRSGKTRASIKATIRVSGLSGVRGRVVTRGAAVFLENGTRAHTITARNGGMLRFFVNGSAVYRRSVQHPGTAARPFMATARHFGEMAIEFWSEIYINRAITGV
jgi:hypothetical protein